jgi:hypothetical protein
VFIKKVITKNFSMNLVRSRIIAKLPYTWWYEKCGFNRKIAIKEMKLIRRGTSCLITLLGREH